MRRAQPRELSPITIGLGDSPCGVSNDGLEPKIGLKGDARQDAGVEVLAALYILHEDTGPIAVAALRGRLGTEVDRPRRETAIIFDIGERIADRGAIGLERRIG